MHRAIFVLLILAPVASLEIVCGQYHNCVFERGTTAMKCWGDNGNGQLGLEVDSNNRNLGDDANEMGVNLPLVGISSNFSIEATGLGFAHSCALSDKSAMKCFGWNADSQLGFSGETTTGDALPFVEFGANTTVSKLSVGSRHTCTLLTDAALKCFGRNQYGQCGAGTTTTPISGPPSQISTVELGTGFTPIDVHTSYDHVCVISQQQTLKCFGYNQYGQLGYGDTTHRGSTAASMGDGLPIVDLGSNFIVVAIATGIYHSCALSTMKTVKCWGRNDNGQCGTSHSTETGDNLPVLQFGADFVPMQLALGASHTCILSESATLICFGSNAYGQLGIGSITAIDAPSTLTGIDLGTDFVPRQIATGSSHTCAVSTDDDIKCWGLNLYGQLGIGHTNDMGDGPNEMGHNLPFVDVALFTAPTIATSAPTTAPTTAAPTTSKQPTVSPTTSTPTTTTLSPSTEPTSTAPTSTAPTSIAPTSTAPTDSPTTAMTSAPTTSVPSSETPTIDPSAIPSTSSPTTTEPSLQSTAVGPSGSTTLFNYNYIITIRTPDLNSTQILIVIATFNLSSTPLTWTVVSRNDGEDGLATVELLVAVASHEPQDYDVIEGRLREAMVEELGDNIDVDIDVKDATQEPTEPSWTWLLPVAYCIASVCVCFCFAKCMLAKRRQEHNDGHPDAARLEMVSIPAGRALPAGAVNVQKIQSESDVEDEEKNEDIQQPGAHVSEPDLARLNSESNRDEGLRASIVAQTAMGNMAADEFEVVDDHPTNTGYRVNYARAEPTPVVGMQEDEFEVRKTMPSLRPFEAQT